MSLGSYCDQYLNIIDLEKVNYSDDEIAIKIKEELDVAGYVLVRNAPFPIGQSQMAANFLINLCQLIGTPISHDASGTIVWDIKKVVGSSSAVQTFSEHAYEAELHTDTQYRDDPEDYMVLMSLVSASCGGGESLLLSVKDIYAELQKRSDADQVIHALETVDYPFIVPTIFRLKGSSNNEYVFAPILKNGTIRFRVDTIEKALAEHGDNLPREALEAFFVLKDIIVSSEKIIKFSLNPQDILFVNNKTMLHGRTAFSDENRHLLRVRMNRNGG